MRKGTNFTGYVVIAMFAMIQMAMIGCQSSDRLADSPQSGVRAPRLENDRPLATEEPLGFEEVMSYYQKPELQTWIDKIEDEGLIFRPRYSFSISDTVQPEGMDTAVFGQVTTLAFVPNNEEPLTAKYLEIAKTTTRWSVLEYELAFDESSTDSNFYSVAEGVWRHDILATIHPGDNRSAIVIAQGDKIFDYLNCVRDRAAAGCIAGIIGCALTGPAWAGCSAAVCATAIIGAIILCLFTSL